MFEYKATFINGIVRTGKLVGERINAGNIARKMFEGMEIAKLEIGFGDGWFEVLGV